jgi:hypothetical protein
MTAARQDKRRQSTHAELQIVEPAVGFEPTT